MNNTFLITVQIFLRIAGTVLLAVGGLAVVSLAFLAFKGFFTTRGLMVHLPSQGRITPVSALTVIGVVVLTVILGAGLFALGRRHKNTNRSQGGSVSQTP